MLKRIIHPPAILVSFVRVHYARNTYHTARTAHPIRYLLFASFSSSALSTLSGVMGKSLIHTPMAS